MSMVCAISGEAPQVPVASTKSGNVFEKRLIEAYLSENGRDPITNEDLTVNDLVELKSSRTVRPRPPTLTSIPSLLSVFQNEWDALALETYTIRQHLTQTRQELTHALYENDAARRVIARLAKERDEARDALSKVNVNGGTTINGDVMQVDGQELSATLASKVEATQEKLSKTRRKRSVPNDWVTVDAIQSFIPRIQSKPFYPGGRNVSINSSGDLALFGGSNGLAGVFSISQNKLVHELTIGAAVTDTLWAGTAAVVATSAGAIRIFEYGIETTSFCAHAGEVTALSLHPCGEILASVGIDKSYILYDLPSSSQALRVSTTSELTTAAFHPDGHLFAAGGVDGQIKVFDVKSGTNAANFEESGCIQALDFSENGTWLAAVVKGSPNVTIWDLRKSSSIKTIDSGGQIMSVRWDYTGQFLAIAGPTGLAVHHYSKASKEWSEALRTANPAVAVGWGLKGHELISLNERGVISVLCNQ